MRYSVSTYSFYRYLENGTVSQLGCIEKAKQLGFEAVEFVDILPHDNSTELEYAKKLRAECERLSMPVTSYTFGADFINKNTAEEIERVKAQIDIAEILGAPRVRHDATSGFKPGEANNRGFDDILPVLADACREVTKYAQTKGIKTCVENHGYFCQFSRRVEKLANRVAHENFGLLCDIGNFLCVDEDPVEAVKRVAPYAIYVHAKDFIVKSGSGPNPGDGFFSSLGKNYLRGTIVGHGAVPVEQCMKILQGAGYNGDISIEFEGLEDNMLGLEIGLANLKRYCGD